MTMRMMMVKYANNAKRQCYFTSLFVEELTCLAAPVLGLRFPETFNL